MKERQREEALEQGYDLITWTFDPLESANTNLNIGKLKGMSPIQYRTHTQTAA